MVKSRKKQMFYPEVKFGNFTDIDAIILFYNRVNSLLNPDDVVLDVGCGTSTIDKDTVPFRKKLRIIKGKVKKVIGIDVDSNAIKNPYIDEFRLINSNTWPIEDNSIDLIISDCVLEHFENPEIFFSESRRVLKYGGNLCFETPNIWNYIAVTAKLIPNKYHARILKYAQGNRQEEDVFPTLYRCNSINKIKRMMKKFNFDFVVYGYEGEPAYLSFSLIAYIVGVIHQKITPRFIKATIFAFGKCLSDE